MGGVERIATNPEANPRPVEAEGAVACSLCGQDILAGENRHKFNLPGTIITYAHFSGACPYSSTQTLREHAAAKAPPTDASVWPSCVHRTKVQTEHGFSRCVECKEIFPGPPPDAVSRLSERQIQAAFHDLEVDDSSWHADPPNVQLRRVVRATEDHALRWVSQWLFDNYEANITALETAQSFDRMLRAIATERETDE